METPDIWWTAAASVSKDFYKEAVREEVPVAAGASDQAPPSFQPGQKRAHSPTRQHHWRWHDTRPVSQVAKAGEDAEGDFGEIRLSYEQTWSPEEASDFSSESSKRRRRQIEHDFERRVFTNNPQKAVFCFKQ